MPKNWTKEEDEYIIANFKILDNYSLANNLNRTKSSISHRLSRLKLDRGLHKKYSEAELNLIRELINQGLLHREVAKITGRTTKSIKEVCSKYKISNNTDEKHGMTNTDLYKRYRRIVSRCETNDKETKRRYADRGILMCNGWRYSFTAFKEWSYSNGYKEELTIDRTNNNKGYTCGACSQCVANQWEMNCRWVDNFVQQNNRECNVRVIAFGENKTVAEWTRDPRCVVSYGRLITRIQNGDNPEISITTPALHRYMTAFGETKTLVDWSKDDRCKVKLYCLKSRYYKKKYTPEQMLETDIGQIE